jgi:hypothetical protein
MVSVSTEPLGFGELKTLSIISFPLIAVCAMIDWAARAAITTAAAARTVRELCSLVM